MTGLGAIVRGLASRAGSSVMMLIVMLVAAAAAATGPAYYTAAKTSILRDTMASASQLGRGFEVVQAGSVAGTIDSTAQQVQGIVASGLGSPARAARLFEPPVEALEATAYLASPNETVPLVWRSDFCAHLSIQGACPQGPGQVAISASLARSNGWTVGERITFADWGRLTITAVYTAATTADDYWFTRADTYFPYEIPPSDAGRRSSSMYDAMFTPRTTIEGAGPSIQGTDVIDDLVAQSAVRAGDVTALDSAISGLVNSQQLTSQQVVASSEIPTTMAQVTVAWSSLSVPVFLVTVQLLALAWLLLFLVVTDAVDARGPEVALAKLRGHGRLRTLVFGLSEPVSLLLICLPAGAVAGWGTASLLSGVLLRAHTPVPLPALGWAAAAVATLGGLAAVGLASQRTIRRPVVEHWRRAGRHATERGWVVDGILLTGAVAGLLELTLSGQVTSVGHGALSLLVPGLLGLAAAVMASRLLPVICRLAARVNRVGGLATYLAVRHVARRPGGSRTTIILATSFALATFAIGAWVVNRSNDGLVADTDVGAPTVLTVATPAGQDLGRLVDGADPSGRLAAAVDEIVSNGVVTLAVDPARFAAVASWRSQFAPRPLSALVRDIDPPEPPAITIDGDALRVTVNVTALDAAGIELQADVLTPEASAPTPVDLGPLPPSGTVTASGPVVGCPCILQDLTLIVPPNLPDVTATLSFANLQVHEPTGWTTLGQTFAGTGLWRSADVQNPPDTLAVGPDGLRWHFDLPGTDDPTLLSVNRPSPLPAIVARPLTASGPGNIGASGLDGRSLPVSVAATASAIPGAPADGVVVDRTYAELAAAGDLTQITQEVWLAGGAAPAVESRLRAAGVTILASQSAASAAAMLGRQGPGLASVLLLAEAGAAAVLAAGGAILGLFLSARRRRYEYAALSVSGLSRRTLFRALALEQLLVLAFGTTIGIVTGLSAMALALRDVPEFLSRPSAPPLVYVAPAAVMAALLGVMVAAILIASMVATVVLIRGVRLEQLREAPA